MDASVWFRKKKDVSDNWTKPHGGVGNLPIVFQIKHGIIWIDDKSFSIFKSTVWHFEERWIVENSEVFVSIQFNIFVFFPLAFASFFSYSTNGLWQTSRNPHEVALKIFISKKKKKKKTRIATWSA
jgi:hypothetical protein